MPIIAPCDPKLTPGCNPDFPLQVFQLSSDAEELGNLITQAEQLGITTTIREEILQLYRKLFPSGGNLGGSPADVGDLKFIQSELLAGEYEYPEAIDALLELG